MNKQENNLLKERRLQAIQNFGEQHPLFFSDEMNEWRKKDNLIEDISPRQLEALKNGCPNCGDIHYHTVINTESESNEVFVHCENCLMSMDSDGGYTN